MTAFPAIFPFSSRSGKGADSRITPGSRVGIVVIDVQKVFVESAANRDMSAIFQNTIDIFHLGDETQVPFFITYERTTSGDYDIPPDLRRALPRGHHSFIKTTFAATGLDSFTKAIQSARLTHVILLGSETDVCVLQTALGLRKMGLSVLLLRDAVFSSESNTGPALRRMSASGVQLVDTSTVRSLLAGGTPLPPSPDTGVSILDSFVRESANIALVLNGFDEATISTSHDRFSSEKIARLRELMILSAWWEIPVYHSGEAKDFHFPPLLREILGEKGMSALDLSAWRPSSDLANKSFGQIVIAGTEKGIDSLLASTAKGRQVFVLEDALLAENQTLHTHAADLVPLTYKSLYYGLKRSIDGGEWPSKEWVQRARRFEPLFKGGPEQLPPIDFQ